MLLLVLFLLAASWIYFRSQDRTSGTSLTTSNENTKGGAIVDRKLELSLALDDDETVDETVSEPIYSGQQFHPDQVIGNPDCTIFFGNGSARDLSVVVLPNEAGQSFAIVDGSGVLSDGTIPFDANQFKLRRREDGTLVFAVRKTSRVPRTRPSEEPLQPMQVYHDSHLVYESDNAWEFEMAPDGSTLAVHEPSTAGASRLVVKNFDAGTEHFVDLGDRLDYRKSNSATYRMRYSGEGSELIFPPLNYYGNGVHHIYSLDDEAFYTVNIHGKRGAWISSSGVGYVTKQMKPGANGTHTLAKIGIEGSQDIDDADVIWETPFEFAEYQGGVYVSDNERWLMLWGPETRIFDTSSGSRVLIAPTTPTAFTTEESRSGVHWHVFAYSRVSASQGRFIGDNVLLYHQYKHYESCHETTAEEPYAGSFRDCVQEHEAEGRNVSKYEVYHLNNLNPDGQPSYSAIYEENAEFNVYTGTSKCLQQRGRFQGLGHIDGELVYRPMN